MTEENEQKQEILIIRRRSGEDMAAVKGGAWKIAYADFVTAMMAFFLVMWLINSANEATKARVASYFNPIKMTDATATPKGVNTVTSAKPAKKAPVPEGKSAESGIKASAEGASDATLSEAMITPDATLLSEPYKALDAIAKEGEGNPSGRTIELTNQKSGDPFDPRAWEALRNGKQNDGKSSAEPSGEKTEPGALAQSEIQVQEHVNDTAMEKLAAGMKPDVGSKSENADDGNFHDKGNIAQAGEKLPHDSTVQDASRTDRIKQQVEDELALLTGQIDIKVNVVHTEEGTLIQLEETGQHGMFEIGSAKPNPTLVRFIGKLGQILNAERGKVIIRGHTDARRFRADHYDNWQLSSARAHMASYMLIRGGLNETRIYGIEAYGASRLLDTVDPLAATNRRVEFLLGANYGP